ncbi:hypothetical protein B0H10DRAFT_2186718 [Mycena sp. CBHHK59/15]|nr:hypothetical protein B0H10DRAFT_2186718 [Mycena sp. CBHHK59/15]
MAQRSHASSPGPSRCHSRSPRRHSRSQSRHSSSPPCRRPHSPAHRGSSRASQRSSSSQGRNTEQDDDGATPGVDYKAAFLALQASNEFQAQRKRKRDGSEKTVSTQAMGRGIRMLAALFGEIPMIVTDAEAYALDRYGDDDFDEFSENLTDQESAYLADKRECERNLGAYQQIMQLVPALKHKLVGTGVGTAAALIDFYAALQKGANDSRSDDIGRLSRSLGSWINADRDRPDLSVFDHTPSIVDQEGKTIRQYAPLLYDDRVNRGVEHDLCGGLLSPIELDWGKKDIRIQLCAGTVPLSKSFFCCIFYFGFNGDPDDVDVGFLKSRYLVKRPKTTSKVLCKPACEIFHMDGKVTPRSIAYIAVIEHFALTSAHHWTPEYYGFSYPQMYNFIVDYFEAPRESTPHKAHVEALLEWWNKQIFPTHASSARTHHTAVTSMAKLQAQRRAQVERVE